MTRRGCFAAIALLFVFCPIASANLETITFNDFGAPGWRPDEPLPPAPADPHYGSLAQNHHSPFVAFELSGGIGAAYISDYDHNEGILSVSEGPNLSVNSTCNACPDPSDWAVLAIRFGGAGVVAGSLQLSLFDTELYKRAWVYDVDGNLVNAPVLHGYTNLSTVTDSPWGPYDPNFGPWGGLDPDVLIRLIVIEDTNGNGFVLDDLEFDFPSESPVPEPASFLLVGAALFGLGLLKRRRS